MTERKPSPSRTLRKTPTGIQGLDEIMNGGLPWGRPTLLCGGPGCGKTILAMEFVCRGVSQFGERGLFVSFEETTKDIEMNFATSEFGFLEASGQGELAVKSIGTTPERIAESGEFTLDGLLVRLERWLGELGFKRLALDSIDALFSLFSGTRNLRLELARVFRWIKEREITAIVTTEKGVNSPTRHGLEEYLTDCVIVLNHSVSDQISKRRLRVLKYRGSSHGVDEYPYLIGSSGISVLPITSVDLDTPASVEYLSTGIPGLDAMLAGRGFYRGSTILLTGSAGTGKSTIAARFAESLCQQDLRCLYLSFEESAAQLARNVRSVGIDLNAQITRGLLTIDPVRPSAFGLEEHLLRVELLVRKLLPDAVVLDPISSFSPLGYSYEIKAMFVRLLHYLKTNAVTLIMTSLVRSDGSVEENETGTSSLVDALINIRFVRTKGVRRRLVEIQKARGMAHSDLLGELLLSEAGAKVAMLAAEEQGVVAGDR